MSAPTFILESEDHERYTFTICQGCRALVSYYDPHTCPGVTR